MSKAVFFPNQQLDLWFACILSLGEGKGKTFTCRRSAQGLRPRACSSRFSPADLFLALLHSLKQLTAHGVFFYSIENFWNLSDVLVGKRLLHAPGLSDLVHVVFFLKWKSAIPLPCPHHKPSCWLNKKLPSTSLAYPGYKLARYSIRVQGRLFTCMCSVRLRNPKA